MANSFLRLKEHHLESKTINIFIIIVILITIETAVGKFSDGNESRTFG